MGTIYKKPGRKYWQLQYLDANGKRVQKSSRTTDKATANQLLVSLEIHAAQTVAGVRNSAGDKLAEFGKQPIQRWIDDYIASLAIEHGTANEHVQDTRSKIEKTIAGCEISIGSRLTADLVIAYTSERKRKDNLSARTIQSYFVALKSFSKWCVVSGRLLADPLTQLRSPSPAKDRRYIRRAISRDEWLRLRQAAETGPTRRKIPGPERALLYEMALVTGLRAVEIEGLTRSGVVLSDNAPYVMLPGANTKNAKPAEQFLTPSLADKLKKHLSHKMRGVKVFSINDLNRLAIVLRADMNAARAKWLSEAKTIDEKNIREASDFLKSVDSEGRKFDFHGLRYTCGAWLALGGIHAKQIQKMLRHSTIRLTLDTYGHLFPEQQQQAIEALGRLTA